MEYTVLARRFRPQRFGEVVGQESIAQALRNAIASERVAHAYLFTGARGVGKTSTARILAKSLNCPDARDGDPCNECEICRAISAGSDVDVIEIDGASNRGIDEIRDLRANVSIRPMRCRYKIYIIDEVHMLTTPAFNALLKTLEEPPGNVKFIFCTTEPEKVPDTILSRCQRFDFGTIATATIRQRLAEIAAAEGVVVEPAALELVARRANGSMRDSQSLFDQLLAFGGKTIGPADVHRLLGTAPDDRLLDLVDALVQRDRKSAIERLQAAIESGAQLSELVDQLLACLRDLMVLGAGAAEAGLMSVGDEQRPHLTKHAQAWGLASVLAAMQILSEAKAKMKGVAYGRILAELALVRIASLEDLSQLAEAVALLKTGKLGAVGSATPSLSRPTPRPTLTGAGRPAPEPSRPPAPSPPEAPMRQPPEQGVAADSHGEDRPNESVPPVSEVLLLPGKENEIWAQVIDLLADMTRSVARKASDIAISGPNHLVLTFPTSYYQLAGEHLRPIEAALQRIVGVPVRVQLVVSEVEVQKSEAPEARSRDNERDRDSAESDVLVQRALAAFGATLVKVEPAGDILRK